MWLVLIVIVIVIIVVVVVLVLRGKVSIPFQSSRISYYTHGPVAMICNWRAWSNIRAPVRCL